MRCFLSVLLATVSIGLAQTIDLSDAQALEIGRRIWKNECGGTVGGLTTWNTGEEFASLGIAHFIWYPEGKKGPFEESFPELIRFLAANGVKLPGWLRAVPLSRAQFQADFQATRMLQLRDLLRRPLPGRRFAALRLEQALRKCCSDTGPAERE
jgi:hypothetical protein